MWLQDLPGRFFSCVALELQRYDALRGILGSRVSLRRPQTDELTRRRKT